MRSPEPLHPELAQELRAIAPRPSPAFRARLDAEVAAGFPRPARRWPSLRPRLLVPALGTLGAAALAVVVIAVGGGSDAGTTASAPEIAAERATGDADSAGGSAAAPVVPQAGVAPAPDASRRVERSARLELGAPAGRFSDVTDAVIRTTQRHDGFVGNSQIGRSGSGGTATFTLRIPTSRLDAALADLSRLASVRSIEQGTQDLTGAWDATAARLDDARTRRRALVSALATASGGEADRLRSRLADATARVERLERQQRALRARTTYATVDITVVSAAHGAVTPPGGDGPWTPGDAWRDARRGLEVLAGVLIVAASIALPLGLLAALAAWVTRSVRRRRRDAALDAA